MTTSSSVNSGLAVPLSSAQALNVRTAGFAANVQTGTVAFSKSSAVGVDAEANVGDVGLNPGTTQLTLNLSLQANRKYSFNFYFLSGGPKLTLVDRGGRKTKIDMAKSFTVAKTGTYKLTFDAGYSLKNAGFDNLKIKGTSVLPTSTGDKKVDALLWGGTGAWWHSYDAAATKGTDKVSGTAVGLDAKSSATALTYSFLTAQPSGQAMTNFQEMTAAQKDAVRKAFDTYGKMLNVTFTEVTGNGAGDINLGTNDQASSAGYATLPNISGEKDKAYMFLANNMQSNSDQGVQEGGYGYLTIMHEIGHTLGLKHPGNYNAGGGGAPGPYLPAGDDNHQHTIMAYGDNNYSRGVNASTPMLYDVAALQYLYGANQSASTATNGTFSFNSNQNYLQTLWSGNGTDTIDLSQLTHSSDVNLNGGSYSNINIVGAADSAYYSGRQNVAIAYGAQINNVDLSTTSGVAESVTLNAAYKNGQFDSIDSFDAGTDKIVLKQAIFGRFKASDIEFGTTATKSSTRILVNTSTGEVFYDADGNRRRSVAKKIAQYTALANSGPLTAANFSVVA